MFIPGIRPGNDTRDYLEAVMNRITLAGAIFIASSPWCRSSFRHP